jgi:hypothetical protein
VRQKNKKKELECIEESTLLDDDIEEDVEEGATTIEDTKVGVDEESTTPKELESEPGPYWTLAQSTHAYVLSTIASCSNIEALKECRKASTVVEEKVALFCDARAILSR